MENQKPREKPSLSEELAYTKRLFEDSVQELLYARRVFEDSASAMLNIADTATQLAERCRNYAQSMFQPKLSLSAQGGQS